MLQRKSSDIPLLLKITPLSHDRSHSVLQKPTMVMSSGPLQSLGLICHPVHFTVAIQGLLKYLYLSLRDFFFFFTQIAAGHTLNFFYVCLNGSNIVRPAITFLV